MSSFPSVVCNSTYVFSLTGQFLGNVLFPVSQSCDFRTGTISDTKKATTVVPYTVSHHPDTLSDSVQTNVVSLCSWETLIILLSPPQSRPIDCSRRSFESVSSVSCDLDLQGFPSPCGVLFETSSFFSGVLWTLDCSVTGYRGGGCHELTQ
jgi:hypothetical protein